MTKDKIIEILKRYQYVESAVKENKSTASFYVGNRRYEIQINDETKVLLEIIDEVEANAKESHQAHLIEGMKKGRSDVSMMREMPYERSSYYARKQELINKIYDCSISKGLVDYDEILKN